jgi:NAD(P)H-dependent FMN reductase
MVRLMIITVSTRSGRKGPIIAEWARGLAAADPFWQIDAVDLAELGLPFIDEPEHPRLKHYRHDHTKAWSRRVEKAEAFLVVTPEYNFSAAPALLNALDFLSHEWAYKPMAFVSYGGASGGTRSVQMAKQVVTALRMMPIPEAVSIPFFARYIGEDGSFNPDQGLTASAAPMFAELRKWALALNNLRAEEAARAGAA